MTDKERAVIEAAGLVVVPVEVLEYYACCGSPSLCTRQPPMKDGSCVNEMMGRCGKIANEALAMIAAAKE